MSVPISSSQSAGAAAAAAAAAPNGSVSGVLSLASPTVQNQRQQQPALVASPTDVLAAGRHPARGPDAFAQAPASGFSSTAMDTLLEDLLLAKERTAYHRAVVTEITTTARDGSATYHGEAVTSLLHLSVAPRPSTLLQPDAVDASAAVGTNEAAHTAAADGDGGRTEHMKGKETQRSSSAPCVRSRREQALADSISMSSRRSSDGEEGNAPALSATVFVQPPSGTDDAESVRDRVTRTRQRRRRGGKGNAAGVVPATARAIGAAGGVGVADGAAAAASASLTRILSPQAAAMDADIHRDGDYLPDGEDAERVIAERMRVLQAQQLSGATGAEGSLCGTAAFVRPSARFSRGPVPAWLREYSDLLLFDRHHLDRDVAAALQCSGVGTTWRRCCASNDSEGLVQLPVDAVVLRLRSDIARVRRLRDELRRDGGIRVLISLGSRPARCEVYRPADPDWGAAPAPPTAGEIPEAVSREVQELAAGGVEVALGDTDRGERGARRAVPPSPPAPPPSTPPLSRAVEAKDLQRSLLAQTIPVWRRHGAAVKLLTELLDHLESRLRAFEAQLSDPAQGVLLDLVGAPDSAGVDGTVQSTYPPALERAIRTTITNTMLSDVFATSWSALPNRGPRLSEALRRRQTPLIHADYVTMTDMRPVYDFTALQSVQRVSRAASSTPGASLVYAAHHQQQWRSGGGGGGGVAAAVGGDTRKSYSVHVDYVRFQPSLESIRGASALGAHLGVGDSAAAAVGTDGGGGGGGRRSSVLSSSEDPLSSLLLGSSSNAFLPRDTNASGDGTAADAHDALLLQQQRRNGSLHSTAAALLFALSAATAQHNLVAFSPEEYLTSLLLQYYEQYRLLQLNLLPSLKNRFFYQEQVLQLQRQSQRTSDMDQLQLRLESLAKTSADVERGCLHVMIVLWNSVLILRRQKQEQGQHATEKLGGATTDAPIIVESQHRSSRGRGEQPTVTAMAQEMRSHPPVFGAEVSAAASEDEIAVQVNDELIANAPVVHRVDNSVTYGGRADRDDASPGSQPQQQGSSRVSSPRSFVLFPGSPPAQPSASASASPLLAPATSGSSGEVGVGDSSNEGDGRGAVSPPWPRPRPRPQRFRFFLRRYGTAEETPYVAGDDLLHYAAEVEGADVLQTGRQPGERGGGAAAVPPVAQDELMYFQLVVFTRSHAAMVPQYVGCTTPRPMTAAKVVFFNETFEVRALHEPAELLLHLIPVTAGPSKHTVVSTVRLQPTLARTYSLLPLQPPTAFVFHGRLFAHHQRAAAGTNDAAPSTTTATSVHGVLAASTTWTGSQGMAVAQIERLFLGGGSSGPAADPLDPQYLPLLCTLRAYYEEQGMGRASAASGGGAGRAPSSSHRRHSADGSARLQRQVSTPNPRNALAGMPAGRAGKAHLTALGGSRRSFKHIAFSGQLLQRVGSAVGAAATALTAPDGMRSTMQVLTAAAEAAGGGCGGRDCYAADDSLQRLPSARLEHLRRRWLAHTNKIKAVDEVEARLFACAMPLDDADVYQLQKALKRSVRTEEAERVKSYGAAAGALFNVQHYYSAPSAISGLPLSPLPRETKLKLWQERQRRLLLTLKARHHLTDAEKLEAVVRVPKLVLKLVFDFAPRSQLNPHRKVRPKTEDIDRALLARRRDSHIVIHIMKAHNLPLRADGTPLEPFVQASFVSEVAYTRSEVGSNPSWFQSLELPFQPLNFEEDTLGMIDDDVIISLYDKVEVKMAPSAAATAAVAHETHYRTERRFIGTLRIPFYSLHQASQARMEGVYPLRMPRWLLGYHTLLPRRYSTEDEAARQHFTPECGTTSGGTATPAPNPFGSFERLPARRAEGASGAAAAAPQQLETSASAVLALTVDNTSSDRQSTEPTLQLYMSLWPPLQREPPPRLSRAELTRQVSELNVSPQLRYLHQVALKWQQAALKKVKAIGAMNAQASTRQIEPFVKCSTGDLMLVCRYILPRGGPPPPCVRTVHEAIRYVSLLPLVADMLSWGEKDVWNTNAELLAMRSGDCGELALLLAHFLRCLAPDRPTYAVLGSGTTTCQQTIMVLHAFDDAEWMLIDPHSGWTVSAGKPYGTVLRDVYMVISHDQLWANVQLSGFPHRMTWDLANPAHWLPCFDSAKDARIAVCTPHLFPIQRDVLTFPAADPVKSREIELELRACLKKALLTWRNGCPPAYHRGVEAILRELLELAEAERCTCASARRSDITLSAAARLSEYFGENITGEPESDMSAAQRRQQHKRRQHRHRHRSGDNGSIGREEDAAAFQPGTTTPVSSSVSPLRLLGSPVMGSYNPSDPQFQELLQQVFECAVHEVGTSEASFAVGTYVKSYTGDVYAMSVFLVAICRG
ncbi:conserved hypothetical protein [Leishmania infantum JPCM5]|uniref:C2 domain-containing protein n=2 Tax=Leishmania infantum TaxID=5671 RepID=A4HRJ6_LEIIN|nr:conserved hypothetical protein [Leishmania infantum JPCM5]CAM65226.1 conserved hypothetical protein [Leishmania infantum JPCM5]|eukprot:XP_001462688.1 conserved hypothetical protein [Leishmania infantum JPCM5]